MQGVFSADFETTTDPSDCRVWSWGLCNIDTEETFTGINIQSFMRFCSTKGVVIAWFHNLAFDGKFIVDFLLRCGYEHSTERSPYPEQFTTLVSNHGQFYQIEVCFANGRKVSFRDSLKLFPMSIENLAVTYDMPYRKGEIDYTYKRPIGYQPTEDEIDYQLRDVKIAAYALKHNYDSDLTRMTAGANAFADFKQRFGKKRFKSTFPVLDPDTDAYCRSAYKGGYTYCAKRFKGKVTGKGISVDYNSMYPSQMLSQPFPIGKPLPFEGRYKNDTVYPLYIQRLTCDFVLKPNHVPTVQLNNAGIYGIHNYVEKTLEPAALTLTNVDLDLLFENYDVDVYSWEGGLKFQQQYNLFTDYINYWGEVKRNSKGGTRAIAKLMLNSLYGKFGTNRDVTQKVPFMEDGVVHWTLGEAEYRDPVYVPVACYATAYARRALITGILANYDRFMYCDTDSMHLLGTDDPKGIVLHDSDFCAWKVEGTFDRSKHLRAKSYVLDYDGELTISCAGMPNNVKKLVTFDNFEYGFSNCDENGNILPGYGKLLPKSVPGGVVLKDTPYVLKP